MYWSRDAHPWTRWNPLNGLICYPKEEHLEQREQILPDVHRSGMIIVLLLTSRRPGVFASVDKEPVFLSSSRCSMRSHIRSEESASCATGDARARGRILFLLSSFSPSLSASVVTLFPSVVASSLLHQNPQSAFSVARLPRSVDHPPLLPLRRPARASLSRFPPRAIPIAVSAGS